MIERLLKMLNISAATAWLILVLVVAVATGGYGLGYRQADSQGKAALSQYQGQIATERATTALRLYTQLLAEQARGDVLSLQLLATNAANGLLTQSLQERVPHVSTVYIEKPGAAPAPLPDRPFTTGWVRDYNASLGLGLPGTATPTRQPARAATGVPGAGSIDTADLGRSQVSQGDVLSNHHYNAAICKKIEAQLNAILDLDEGRSP